MFSQQAVNTFVGVGNLLPFGKVGVANLLCSPRCNLVLKVSCAAHPFVLGLYALFFREVGKVRRALGRVLLNVCHLAWD